MSTANKWVISIWACFAISSAVFKEEIYEIGMIVFAAAHFIISDNKKNKQ